MGARVGLGVKFYLSLSPTRVLSLRSLARKKTNRQKQMITFDVETEILSWMKVANVLTRLRDIGN
jgi:hypothetical protein